MHPRVERFLTGSKFAGLEVEFLPQGTALRLVVLKRNGQKVSLEKTTGGMENAEQLIAQLPKDVPLAIVFTGKGVLHRRIAADPSNDAKTLLGKALPNAALKDFYLQASPAAQDELFVSLVRRAAADEVLAQLTQRQLSVVTCSLGPLALTHLLPLLETPGLIRCGTHAIQFEEGKPAVVSTVENENETESFNIGGKTIEGNYLVAFATTFQQLLPAEQRISLSVDALEQAPTDFLRRRLFKTGVMCLLVFTLSVLLTNFFFFSHYREKKSELEMRLQTDGGAFAEVRALETQVNAKRAFLEQAGLLGKAHYAYYADQLAAGLPPEIRLTKLDLAPRLKLSEEDTIGFRPGRIALNGNCSQSVVLNRWLQELKTQRWIHSVQLQSYVQDKTMAQGAFTVELGIE